PLLPYATPFRSRAGQVTAITGWAKLVLPKEFLRQRMFAPTTSAPRLRAWGFFVVVRLDADNLVDHRFFPAEPLVPSPVIKANRMVAVPSKSFGARLPRARSDRRPAAVAD